MTGRLLLLAAFLLFVVFPLTAPAADEPAAVVAARADFLKRAAEHVTDVKKCKMEYLESAEIGHLVRVSCAELPNICLMLIHPTAPMAAPVECHPNPEFVEPKNKT